MTHANCVIHQVGGDEWDNNNNMFETVLVKPSRGTSLAFLSPGPIPKREPFSQLGVWIIEYLLFFSTHLHRCRHVRSQPCTYERRKREGAVVQSAIGSSVEYDQLTSIICSTL